MVYLDRLMGHKLVAQDEPITLIASQRDTSKFLNENFSDYLSSQFDTTHKLKLTVEIKAPPHGVTVAYTSVVTTFYICRHGETENNKNKRLSGWIDTPLTEVGAQDALSAAGKVKGIAFDKVVSSDMGRAFVTAYIITRQLGSTVEIERNRGLREVNYGDLANQPYEAYPAGLTPDENANYVMPNGESLVQMQQRVMTCIQALSSTNPNQTILLVAHDGTINAIRASFTGEDMGTADLTRNSHDIAVKFVYDNGKVMSFDEVITG